MLATGSSSCRPARPPSTSFNRSNGRRLAAARAIVLPDLVTPGELIARLGERLEGEPRLLTETEREVLAGVACRTAIEAGNEPPFRLRPGLVAEIVRFYDSLQRHQKGIDTFERLALGALEPGAARRSWRRTSRAPDAFPGQHVPALRAARRCHGANGRARASPAAARDAGVRSVAHTSCSPSAMPPPTAKGCARRTGICCRDFPGSRALDIVATDAVVAGAFHERIHQLLPGIEEVRDLDRRPARSTRAHSWPGGGTTWTARDREEEVAGFARWVRREMQHESANGVSALDRIALVVYRPLPYVYLARRGAAVGPYPVPDVRRAAACVGAVRRGARPCHRVRHGQLWRDRRWSHSCGLHIFVSGRTTPRSRHVKLPRSIVL